MKELLTMSIIVSLVCCLYAENKPKADVYLSVTGDFPKFETSTKYSGFFSVTNIGEVAFTVVTHEEWSSETTWFYQEGTEEQERISVYHGGKTQKEQDRAWVMSAYNIGIERYPETVKTLRPGESITFACRDFVFLCHFGAFGGIYKAEMYVGNDTWLPVHITPSLGNFIPVFNNERKLGDFYYSQEGTNQYLYIKTDGEFKRVSEMKLGLSPVQEGEDAVKFISPSGDFWQKLNRTQAKQIIHEREQQNQ